MKEENSNSNVLRKHRIIDPCVSEMLFYDELYKKPGEGISRAAYAGNLLTVLKEFEITVKQLPNISKFIPTSYFKRIRIDILKYAHGSPIYRTLPPCFGPSVNYLYLHYKHEPDIINKIENDLSRLKPYIKNNRQKKEYKKIGRALTSIDINDHRSLLFELLILGEFANLNVLVEPFYQYKIKIYDALVKIDAVERLIEITSLQKSKHDISNDTRVGVIDPILLTQQPVKRIKNKLIKGQHPDIFILALGNLADLESAGRGIAAFIKNSQVKSHVLICDYSFNGNFYLSSWGPVLSTKEKAFFEIFCKSHIQYV